jgi:hypothetical protein
MIEQSVEMQTFRTRWCKDNPVMRAHVFFPGGDCTIAAADSIEADSIGRYGRERIDTVPYLSVDADPASIVVEEECRNLSE